MAESSLYKIAHRAKRLPFFHVEGLPRKTPPARVEPRRFGTRTHHPVRCQPRPASRDALKSRGTTEERPVSEADPIPRPRLYKIAHTVRFAPRSFRRHRTRAAADCKSKSVGPLLATTCGPHHRSTTMRFLAREPTCGGKCSAAQCFACLTNCATALVVTGLMGRSSGS